MEMEKISFLAKILNKTPRITHYNAKVCVLGPPRSGKTTFVRYLEEGVPQYEDLMVTMGKDYRRKPVNIANWRFSLIDVGGQKVYQDVFWQSVINESDAVIFVVDATVRLENKDFPDHLAQFQYVLNLLPEDHVLLVLLNKQDLVENNPITPKEFAELYPINRPTSGVTLFLPTSAKYGTGIENAMDNFINAMLSAREAAGGSSKR